MTQTPLQIDNLTKCSNIADQIAAVAYECNCSTDKVISFLKLVAEDRLNGLKKSAAKPETDLT